MASKGGWSREFDDPIVLADGTKLTTLRQAVAYLAKTVPKADLKHPKVLTAAEMLTNAGERELAWVLFARMATLRAINRDVEIAFTDRTATHWGKRKPKRDR